jgi:ribonuclease P protein component
MFLGPPTGFGLARRPSHKKVKLDDQADISTEQPAQKAQARLPRAHANPGRPGDHQAQAGQGPLPPGGVANGLDVVRGSLSGRAQFERVRSQGRRVQGQVVTVYGCRARSEGVARLGLAVPGKGVTAVTRNRIKRRVRAAFASTSPRAGLDVVVRAGGNVASVRYHLLAEDVQLAVAALSREEHS